MGLPSLLLSSRYHLLCDCREAAHLSETQQDCLLSVTHMPLGMFIFLPISATLAFYIQSHVTTTALQASRLHYVSPLL